MADSVFEGPGAEVIMPGEPVVGPAPSWTQPGTGANTGDKKPRASSRDGVGTRGSQNVPSTLLTDRLATESTMHKMHSHSSGDNSRVQTGAKSTRGGTRISFRTNRLQEETKDGGKPVLHPGTDRNAINSRAASNLRAPSLQRARSDLIRETVAELQKGLEPFLNKEPPREPSPDKDSEYYDTDCESEVSPTAEVDYGRREYETTCQTIGISPVDMVQRQLHKTHMAIKNQGLNKKDILSICNTLLTNQSVRSLILDGNRFGDHGAEFVAALLCDDNCEISSVAMDNNQIGSKGVAYIAKMMEENNTISNLSLSGNLLKDQDAFNISNILKTNKVLQDLDLSHNHLGNDACVLLGAGIAVNESIRSLNLSWNKIRPPGAKSLALGMKENVVLKSLNVSMNGFSREGAEAMGSVLRTNQALTDLDMSHNRVSDLGALGLIKGLQTNETLVYLKLANNPITSNGGMTLLAAINRNEHTAVRLLDLSTVHIHNKGEEMITEMKFKILGLRVLYSGTIASMGKEIKGGSKSDGIKNRNPMSILRDYIEKAGLRLVDFFKQFDKDGGGSISRQEFIQGLQNNNVPLTTAQMDELITTLDKDGDGEVDYGELVYGDKEYRRMNARGKRTVPATKIMTG